MPITSRLLSLCRNLLQRKRVERDLDEELQAAFELLVDQKVRADARPDEARRAAALELGGVEAVKEQVREAWTGAFADILLQDLRYAVRLLWRNPLFTLTAALSLAVGIGATTSIFTVANGLLLRAPAGVTEADRLVDIVRFEEGRTVGVSPVSYVEYLEISRRVTTLDGVYAYQLELETMSLRMSGPAESVFANFVTLSYFDVLGVRATAGRLFNAADKEQPGASPIAVLSHRFWTRRFKADPAIVGQTLQLNGQAFTIVGVVSEAFRGTSVVPPDVWLPTTMADVVKGKGDSSFQLTRSMAPWLMLGGRLKPGVSRAEASAEVHAIGEAIARAFPKGNRVVPKLPGLREISGWVWSVEPSSPIPSGLRALVAGFLALLMGLVSTVLVIACTNLASVLLARAASRRREIAVRLAIGAGRARLVRQLLTETLLLFLLGGAGGLLLARGMTSSLFALLPTFEVPVDVALPLDGRVIAFTIALSLVAALLSGLTPALQASKDDVVSALKDESGGSFGRLRLRSAFVVAQVAFSILLVVAAGLLGRAVGRVTATDRGFDPRGIELASLDLSIAGYTEITGRIFAGDLLDRIRGLPGVEAATLADAAPSIVPRGGMMMGQGLVVPGVAPPNGQELFMMVSWHAVAPGYFETLRIPLVAGRSFTAADRANGQRVVIVTESTARRLWPRQSPLGKQVLWQAGPPTAPPPLTSWIVVGVVRDLHHGGPSNVAPPITLYAPFQQRHTPTVTIIARTTHGQRIANEIRALVASMNPNLPILTAQTLEDHMVGPVELQLRIAASVSGTVGLVGLLLATIGIYGVTAYAVARRTREIGIRLALGARRADIVGMVLRQGFVLVLIGSAIGLMLAAAGSRLLARLLFGVPPLDPITFAGATLLFAIVGLAACYVPACRATRIDAMEALRYE